MRRLLYTAVVTWLLVAPLPSELRAAGGKSPAPPPALKVGDMAPDFKMQYFDGNDVKEVTLAQYRGKKNVVLAFYVFAFTGG
jgi:hypothetical protein